MKTFNIILCGACGRVSKKFIFFLNKKRNFSIISFVSNRIKKGNNFGKIKYFNNLKEAIEENKKQNFVILDFSHFSNIVYNLRIAFFYKKPIIFIQSEGEKFKDFFKFYSNFIPILLISNSSLGANLLFDICEFISRNLPKNESICYEIHHKQKKEIYSSTIKDIVKNKNISFLNISSFRVSNILGIHKFIFFNDFEEICVSHRINNFDSFCVGFLNSIIFIYFKKFGLFFFKDIYNLAKYYV